MKLWKNHQNILKIKLVNLKDEDDDSVDALHTILSQFNVDAEKSEPLGCVVHAGRQSVGPAVFFE